MLGFIRSAALAALLSLVPATSLGSATNQAEVRTAAAAPRAAAQFAPAKAFGLDAHDHESGLASGQTAEDFEAWLVRSPANRDGR